ncbi:glycerophosphodiester phosphodiesterase [Nesterenkonia salmonea]|uniref:Glycerophosphodiester phosphodiesterase n=1 Tax=Nesterenkonia salmonea TaxID=1804987 RepID=A0A5R9B7I3_9MICC|nr:glycerophosphodiester phosphodiesterase [Nesterenkonia salmonea]
MSKVPSWLVTRPVAHRGLHGDGRPENTLAAFEAAVQAGLPIELDVQLTADHKMVVHHDTDLKRLSGRDERVRDMTVDQLRNIRIAGTDQHPPSLSETLDYIDGRVPILLEIKAGDLRYLRASATGAAVRDYAGPLAVQSFDPFIVAWFHRNAPEVVRGQLAGSLADVRSIGWGTRLLLQNLALTTVSRPHYVGYEFGVTTRMRSWLIRRKWPLILWTITTRHDMDQALELADNVIFEGFDHSG